MFLVQYAQDASQVRLSSIRYNQGEGGNMLKIEIDTDNEAFESCVGSEVARILRRYAEKIADTTDLESVLKDINGNTVGHAWELEND